MSDIQQNIPSSIIIDINKRISELEKVNPSIASILFRLAEIEKASYEVNERILQEILDRRDEGKAIYGSGTLSTTSFTVIDLVGGTSELGTGNIGGSPNHPVKGYTIENTGTTNMFVGHNITNQPQLDLDITLDSLKANPIFLQILPNESEIIRYNTNSIRSVHLLAVTGNPTYKIKFVW